MKAKLTKSLVGILGLISTSTATAIPYASGISQTGDTVSFILNQDAYSVQAILDGGTQTLNLSTSAGELNFNLSGYSTYEIRVVGYEPLGWSQYVPDQTSTNFFQPVGVSTNTIASSPDFGKVYVSNATSGTTLDGRSTDEGIWMVRADGSDLGIGSATGVTWGGNSGPWKSAIGADGHLYVTDYSDDLVYEFDGNVAAGTQLIDASNKTTNQYVASVFVEGTQSGGDRTIYLVNSNYNDTARKGLISYDLGGNSAATTDDTGTQVIGPTYYTYYPTDVVRDSNGDWYLNQFRYDPTEAAAISKFDGTASLPINTALWETPKVDPYNGAYAIDIYEEAGWVAYGNYYDGWVRIFDMSDGSYLGGFDAGVRLRDLAFDAVGNLITVDNLVEHLRFWSPGGAWETVYVSDGTFRMTQISVPEPTTLGLLSLGGMLVFFRRRR